MLRPDDVDRQAFRHEAFLYSRASEYVDQATTFIRDGLDAGEAVMVMVSSAKIERLRERLNGHSDGVRFADMSLIGRNPARIIPAWQHFVARHADDASALRGIGEPIWPGRSAAELAECQIHESLLNIAFQDGPPFWLLCPYDAAGLDDEVVAEAMRHHPHMVAGGVHHHSATYDPPDPAAPHAGRPLPPPPPDAEAITIDSTRSLADVRRFTRRLASQAGLSSDRERDFVVAVNELAANSLLHGGGAASVHLWCDSTTIFGEVRDRGHITDPLAGRVAPSPHSIGGRGLWITNEVCDLVHIRSTPTGTAIRLRMAR